MARAAQASAYALQGAGHYLQSGDGRTCRYPTDPDGAFALRHALRLESIALRDYMRVLRIFTGLVVDGIVPREEDAGPNRVAGA